MRKHASKRCEELGERVRCRRHELGISQETLASRAGVHRNTVRLLEAGEISVSLVTITRVLHALGTTYVELGPGKLCPCFGGSLSSAAWTAPFGDEASMLTTLGQAIAEKRMSRGLTQEQLAERANLHPHTVGEVERGSMNPTIATLFALYRALDVRAVAPPTAVHGLRLID